MDEKRLRDLLDSHRTGAPLIAEIERIERKYLGPPTCELNIPGILSDTYAMRLLIDEKDTGFLEELIKGLSDMLYGRGHREEILTLQEHKLIGSTRQHIRGINPYKVIGLETGHIASVEAARAARRLERVQHTWSSHWGLDSILTYFVLPTIDRDGMTKHDPWAVDHEGRVLRSLIDCAPYSRMELRPRYSRYKNIEMPRLQ
jgi:hypothetical protein